MPPSVARLVRLGPKTFVRHYVKRKNSSSSVQSHHGISGERQSAVRLQERLQVFNSVPAHDPYLDVSMLIMSTSLNYNHWMMKELLGYLLNPKVIYDKTTVRIADIGTGTA